MLWTIYYWFMESVCSTHFYSPPTVIALFTVLTIAACLAGFWCAIGGAIYTATKQQCKEIEKKNHPLPTCTKEFEAFAIKRGTPLPIRRQLAGIHQVRRSLFWSILRRTQVSYC